MMPAQQAAWPLSMPPGACGWLASVRDADEATLALAAGASIIDAKEPRHGALGALPAAAIAAIVARIGGAAPVSATIGDLPLDPALLAPAMLAVAAAGADIVKIGVFGRADPARLARCLADLPARLPGPAGGRDAARVAVLMADREGRAWPLATFAHHGFAGVMLDTADKRCGGLRAVLSPRALADFVDEAHALGLRAGLAGSLRASDVPALLPLRPDYLGFRTALCAGGERVGRLDAAACAALASHFRSGPAQDPQPARPSNLMVQAARPA